MTSPIRDWDSAIREDRGEPLQFRLGGTEFSVPSPLPGADFFDLADRGEEGEVTMMSLLCGWLDPDGAHPEVRREFHAAYRRSRGSLRILDRIAKALIEEDSARPTTPPSASPGSPPPTGVRSSNGASRKAAPARSRRAR